MLDTIAHRVLLRLAPFLVRGGTLHRRALAASGAGRFTEAEQLFEAAAGAYRRELEVEALARLRVHQVMTRARAGGDPGREAAMMLDIVRGLNRLDRLESFTPPYALRDAREVFAEWLAATPAGAARLPSDGALASAA